ncbi:MAG: hypothetical protein EA380_00030, partial [Phycisphaeraceae bacterium]
MSSESTKQTHPSTETKSAFEQAAKQKSRGVVGEFIDFLKTSKKWWLTPIILVLLLVGGLVLLSGTAAAP